jgi:hypothetical protein
MQYSYCDNAVLKTLRSALWRGRAVERNGVGEDPPLAGGGRATGCMLDGLGFDPFQGKTHFLYSKECFWCPGHGAELSFSCKQLPSRVYSGPCPCRPSLGPVPHSGTLTA